MSTGRADLTLPLGGRNRAGARRLRPGGWRLFQIAVAGVVALPIAAILVNLGRPAGDYWEHALRHALPEMIGNSLLLLGGVGAGTVIGGVAAAWLVTMCRFPGRAVFEWALVLPSPCRPM